MRKEKRLVPRWLKLFCALAALVAGVSSGGGGRAQAGEPARERVAVLKLPFLGISKEIEVQLRAALRETLAREGFVPLPDDEVATQLGREPGLLNCTTRSCYHQLELSLDVQRVIEGEVQRPQRSSYTVQLRVRDLRDGQIVSPLIEERCDICSTEEAKAMVGRAAVRLSRQTPAVRRRVDERKPGWLKLESQPMGAQVVIDGRPEGDPAPGTFIMEPGVHSLELRAPGHKTIKRPVEVQPGQVLGMSLELIPEAPKRPWLTALSIAATVGAVGLAAGAGALFALDGKPSGCTGPVVEGGRCPMKYDNLPQGIALAAGAGVLAIGAGIAFYFDHAPPRRTLMVAPTK